MARATETELSTLHQVVAEALKERISNKDICTAADLNAAIKFLKDNNIQATPEANKHLGELQEELEKQGVEPADDAELQRALDNIYQFPGSVANA